VDAIVKESTEQYLSWLGSRTVVPTIRDLRLLAKDICDAEVARALRRLSLSTEREEQIIHALGQAIVNKLLHTPTVRLKKVAEEGEGAAYSNALRELFNLAEYGDHP
jgi:glutamyl-tRNA reductase